MPRYGFGNGFSGSGLREWEGFRKNALARGEPGFFENHLLRDGSLVPQVSRTFVEVEAGETYYLVGTANGAAGPSQEIVLNVRPVAAAPRVGREKWKSSGGRTMEASSRRFRWSLRIENAGLSGEAQFVVTLTDPSGRETTYGHPSSPAWPQIPHLTLYDPPLDRLELWAGTWLGQDLATDPDYDSDGDGWSDLLEFALGTDPMTHERQDLLASRHPHLTVGRAYTSFGEGEVRSLSFASQPAPWFVSDDQGFRHGEWELSIEKSRDLEIWERVPHYPQSLPGSFFQVPAQDRVQAVRLKLEKPE